MTPGLAMTRHASKRQQQRGIPPLVVDWLLDYGHAERVGGAWHRSFDRDARRELARVVGDRVVQMLSPLLDCYLIEGDNGQIITVGHRCTRIRKS
jgi:hypothetical protein